MPRTITRRELHALAWEKPMIHLAAELGLSDVGLRKTCHRHDIPTPPAGWWAKKAHGKAGPDPPLPNSRAADELISFHGGTAQDGALAGARAAVRDRLGQVEAIAPTPDPVVERTLARLATARPGRDGLKRVSGPGLVTTAVRPASEDRAARLLRSLVSTAAIAGIELEKAADGAAFRCDGETVAVELYEAPDQVAHLPTERELAAVATWKRKREETHRRFGYWSNYGEPRIPKWEDQYSGRLAVRLEQVRARSEDDYWGQPVTRTFADSRTRDVMKMVPRVVEAVAAIAAAKKSNRALDERRRLADEERERQWAEAERLREREERRGRLLDQLVAERAGLDRLAALVTGLGDGGGDDPPPRVARLLDWAAHRLAAGKERLSAATLEERLEQSGLFGEDD